MRAPFPAHLEHRTTVSPVVGAAPRGEAGCRYFAARAPLAHSPIALAEVSHGLR